MAQNLGHVGDKVEKEGNYICSNCGNYQYFGLGDEFEACYMCGEEDIEWEFEE